jgi:HEXXH motif-containing protein
MQRAGRTAHRDGTVKLLDAGFYNRLQREYSTSIRQLLGDLCDELEAQPGGAGVLPLDLFRALGGAFSDEEFRDQKVVGWVEELNDLTYFRDLQARLKGRLTQAMVEDAFLECEAQFYENRYLEDLFPAREPVKDGLRERLGALVDRLSARAIQESVLLAPLSVLSFMEREGIETLAVPLLLAEDFERAEEAGVLPVGQDGEVLLPPAPLRAALRKSGNVAELVMDVSGVMVMGAEGVSSEVLRGLQSSWAVRSVLEVPGHPHFTVGPALKFGKDKMPRKVMPLPADVPARMARALDGIAAVWPEGMDNLRRFTRRVVPIDAPGVVSYSLRNRPNISFINCFHRDHLDLMDDFIHENAHHHLNLLLRKYELKRGEDHRELYYSPWRRALRSIHGILHAAFTFTFGARLFERIGLAADQGTLPRSLGLSKADVTRARFRCLEEVASVEYALADLDVAARKEKSLSSKGVALAALLREDIRAVARTARAWEPAVLKSAHGKALRQHQQTLQEQRAHYTLR